MLHAQRIVDVPDDSLGLSNAAHPIARRVAANELHETVGKDHPPRPLDGDEEIALGVGPIISRFVDEDVVPAEARTIFFHDRNAIGSRGMRAEAVSDFAERRVGAVVIDRTVGGERDRTARRRDEGEEKGRCGFRRGSYCRASLALRACSRRRAGCRRVRRGGT